MESLQMPDETQVEEDALLWTFKTESEPYNMFGSMLEILDKHAKMETDTVRVIVQMCCTN